jgi:hypothetical protein
MSYWYQTEAEYKTEIEETISTIKRVTEELVARGPEACKQFLIDAGIIEIKKIPE